MRMMTVSLPRFFVPGLLIFLLLFSTGSWLSQIKPLWNDEIFTQIHNIERKSYTDILRGRLEEANPCPLFYLVQKAVIDAAGYRFPGTWDHEWTIHDPSSQRILRFFPNVMMSLSMVILLCFFARAFGWPVGMYALGVALASPMVWAYWAEARPYALWFFLTIVQSVLFVRAAGPERPSGGTWKGLFLVHALLALSVVFGVVQAVVGSFLIWYAVDRNWKKWLLPLVVPLGLALYYYPDTAAFKFRLVHSFSLIAANIPPERLAIFLIYGGLGAWGILKKKRDVDQPLSRAGKYFFLFISLMLLLALAMLGIFKVRSAPGLEGFEVSARYFLFLTPLGIVATTVFSVHFLQLFKARSWMWLNTLLVLGGLLIIRLLRTVWELIGALLS